MNIQLKKRSGEDLESFFKKNKTKIDKIGAGEAKAPKAKSKKKAKKEKKNEKAKKSEKSNKEGKEEDIEKTGNIFTNAMERVFSKKTKEENDDEDAVKPVDDLTQISGLGEKMAERLAENGISSFEDIANLTKKKAEALGESVRGFSTGFSKKKWKEQAKKLINKSEEEE